MAKENYCVKIEKKTFKHDAYTENDSKVGRLAKFPTFESFSV